MPNQTRKFPVGRVVFPTVVVLVIAGALVAKHYRPSGTGDAPHATGLAEELFVGHDRGVPKTSIAPGDVVSYPDLKALLASLSSDDSMLHHNPPLTEARDCDRCEEEKRNVRVVAWIYAVKHEDDHDFHVILGSSAAESECEFMTSEVTGLPASGPDVANLRKARSDFIGIVGESVLSKAHRGYEHLRPPIQVEVQGSLFYDVDHRPAAVGPEGMKPKTAWEVHPVTSVRKL